MEKNLQTMETQMHQQVTKYVQLVDLFETQLNDRAGVWHKRKTSREFRQKASMKMISLIISGVIALVAVVLTFSKLIVR